MSAVWKVLGAAAESLSCHSSINTAQPSASAMPHCTPAARRDAASAAADAARMHTGSAASFSGRTPSATSVSGEPTPAAGPSFDHETAFKVGRVCWLQGTAQCQLPSSCLARMAAWRLSTWQHGPRLHGSLALECAALNRPMEAALWYDHTHPAHPAHPASRLPARSLQVLRGAGYYSHALWVAQRAGEPNWQLDVLLEDLGDFDAALSFIGGQEAGCSAAHGLNRVAGRWWGGCVGGWGSKL